MTSTSSSGDDLYGDEALERIESSASTDNGSSAATAAAGSSAPLSASSEEESTAAAPLLNRIFEPCECGKRCVRCAAWILVASVALFLFIPLMGAGMFQYGEFSAGKWKLEAADRQETECTVVSYTFGAHRYGLSGRAYVLAVDVTRKVFNPGSSQTQESFLSVQASTPACPLGVFPNAFLDNDVGLYGCFPIMEIEKDQIDGFQTRVDDGRTVCPLFCSQYGHALQHFVRGLPHRLWGMGLPRPFRVCSRYASSRRNGKRAPGGRHARGDAEQGRGARHRRSGRSHPRAGVHFLPAALGQLSSRTAVLDAAPRGSTLLALGITTTRYERTNGSEPFKAGSLPR
jgi:hypothetical protein